MYHPGKADNRQQGNPYLAEIRLDQEALLFPGRNEYKKGSDYDRFMKALTGYKKEGGNKHDDAPDGMTILAENVEFIRLCKNNRVRQVARGR